MPHVWKRKRRKKTAEEEKESNKRIKLDEEIESGTESGTKEIDDSEEDGIKLNLGRPPTSDDCLTDEEVNFWLIYCKSLHPLKP